MASKDIKEEKKSAKKLKKEKVKVEKIKKEKVKKEKNKKTKKVKKLDTVVFVDNEEQAKAVLEEVMKGPQVEESETNNFWSELKAFFLIILPMRPPVARARTICSSEKPRLSCIYFKTEGTTPQAPQVGAITIVPPPAFCSLVAKA